MLKTLESLPSIYADDIKKAIQILKTEGCTEIYIFGSVANGDYSELSDIDIAIRGLEASKFFKVYGKLMMALNMAVDLVDLDEKNSSFNRIIQEEGLVRVA